MSIKRIPLAVGKHKRVVALTVWFGAMWSWLFFVDGPDLAGARWQGFVMSGFIFVVNVTISVALISCLWKLLDHIRVRYGLRWLLVLGIPVCAVMEFLACWFVALVWIGSQGSLDTVSPMGSLALPLTATPLVYASRFVGFYGLAAAAWLAIYLLTRKLYRKALLPMFLLLILSCLGWLFYHTPNGTAVRTKLISETLVQQVGAVETQNTDLIVFPEYGLDKVNGQEVIGQRIKTSSEQPHKTYFVGSQQINDNLSVGHKNTLVFGNTSEGVLLRQDKYRLIPTGEDAPYVLRLLLRMFGQVSVLDHFSSIRSVIKGSHQLKPFKMTDSVHVAAAVCSSIISPQDYRHFARSGATLFTNSASLGTFNGSKVFTWQQTTLARFMAVANSRYFLQSANSATAYALDINGTKIAETGGIRSLDVTAFTNNRTTPYVLVGEWLVTVGGLVLPVLMLLQRKANILDGFTKAA